MSLIISQPRQTRLAGQRGERGRCRGSVEKLGVGSERWCLDPGVVVCGGAPLLPIFATLYKGCTQVHAGMVCLLTPEQRRPTLRIPGVICFMLIVFGEGEGLPSGFVGLRGMDRDVEKLTELRCVFQAKVFQVGK